MRPKQRQDYLAMAARRVRRGSGSSALALRERTTAYGTPDLRFLVDSVEFVVVGGLATRLYMPERMTLDTDVLVAPSDISPAETALRKAGCRKKGSLAIGGSTWRMPDGRNLDLVALDEPWVDEAVHNPVRGKDGLPYIRLSYLVLMKLGAGRMQDLADISRMLGGASTRDLRAVRRAVARHRPRDAEDLESLIRLGRMEFERAVPHNDRGRCPRRR